MRAAMWWIDRWRQSDAFARMTAEEQGLYRNLCDEVVLREDGIIPDDPRILAKASGDHEAWARSGKSVLKSMKRVAGGWTNETALKVKTESERRSKKQREYRNSGNASGNDVGNEIGNEPDNEHRPPEQEQKQGKNPSPKTTPVQRPSSPSVVSRSDADAATRARSGDLREALQDLRRREHDFSEKPDQAILDCAVFHAPTGPVRIDTCANVALLRATTGKVRAYGQAKKRKAGPKDSSDWIAADASDQAEAGTWIAAHWPDADPESEADLRGLLAALKPPLHLATVIEAELFSRHPKADADWAARIERMRGNQPEPKPAETFPAPKRPEISITVAPGECPLCQGPIRHSTEDGLKVIRCADDEGMRCGWSAVWREVAA